MHDTKSFAPLNARYNPVGPVQSTLQAGVSVTATNANATASTVLPGSNAGGSNIQIQVANKTSAWAHLNFGTLLDNRTVRAAVVTDYPVAPGAVVVVTVDPEVNAASVILDAAPTGSAVVLLTRGEGI